MFAILFLALAVGVQCNFEVIHEWKVLEYDWRSLEQKDEALKDGTFIPENNALTGLSLTFLVSRSFSLSLWPNRSVNQNVNFLRTTSLRKFSNVLYNL